MCQMAVVYSYCAIVPPINIKCAAVKRTNGRTVSIDCQSTISITNQYRIRKCAGFSLNYELVDEHSERHG